MKVGMIAEATCVSKPFTIIPLVVADVQDFIAAGQFRGGERLIEAQDVGRPGTLLVFLEPLYKGGLDDVTPGSSCIANAYSNNHDVIVAKDTGTMRRIVLHVVDALGLVHAPTVRAPVLETAERFSDAPLRVLVAYADQSCDAAHGSIAPEPPRSRPPKGRPRWSMTRSLCRRARRKWQEPVQG